MLTRGALLFCLTTVFSTGAEAARISLRYQYFEKGVSICRGEKSLDTGDDFLLCEGEAGTDRVFIKAKTTIASPNQISIAATIEKIDPNGRVKSVSHPWLLGLNGKQSLITQGNNQIEDFRFVATATILE